MKNIAILGSGAGTNAERIISHFESSPLARVVLVMSNRADAGILQKARDRGVEAISFDREEFYENGGVEAIMEQRNIDFIVLAGFLWLVPPSLTAKWAGRIVNIHPALLPAYGGKGMYGERVHKAVVENRERESGITIHIVNEVYDSGDIIEQHKVAVASDDTAQTLAAKIHRLEYAHFPLCIENQIKRIR